MPKSRKQRKKARIKAQERARRRRQALINFGFRRKSRIRTMPRRKFRKRKSAGKSFFSSALGSGITYAIMQPFIDQLLSKFNIGVQDEVVQIGAAAILKSVFKNKHVNNYARAAIIVNTASLTKTLVGRIGFLQPSNTIQVNQTSTNGATF